MKSGNGGGPPGSWNTPHVYFRGVVCRQPEYKATDSRPGRGTTNVLIIQQRKENGKCNTRDRATHQLDLPGSASLDVIDRDTRQTCKDRRLVFMSLMEGRLREFTRFIVPPPRVVKRGYIVDTTPVFCRLASYSRLISGSSSSYSINVPPSFTDL